MKKYDVNNIIEVYKQTNNIWKAGDILGIPGQTVHRILNKNGVSTAKRPWTEFETSAIEKLYNEGFLSGDGKLESICKVIDRSKTCLCRKARKMGLTNKKRKYSEALSEAMSIRKKEWFMENEHPRGFLGYKHDEDARKKMSEASLLSWLNPHRTSNSEEYKQTQSDKMTEFMINKLTTSPESQYSRGSSGYVSIGDKRFYARSSWESNVAAYFEYLKCNNLIFEWEYEPCVFVFKNIKRGTRSYRPDFKIINNDKSFYYVEVKGWLDEKSITKIDYMKRFYPDVLIKMINKKEYDLIKKQSESIPNWGILK